MPSITELGRPGASPGGWAVCPPSGWRLMTAGLCLLHRAGTLEFRAMSLSLDGEPLRANTDFFYRLAASESRIVSPPSDRGLLRARPRLPIRPCVKKACLRPELLGAEAPPPHLMIQGQRTERQAPPAARVPVQPKHILGAHGDPRAGTLFGHEEEEALTLGVEEARPRGREVGLWVPGAGSLGRMERDC